MDHLIDATMLRSLRAQRRAVIGFSIYNLEQGLGVVRAAADSDAPVILQAGSSAFRYAGRDPLARLASGLAQSATVPVGVHLDHATDLGEIDDCLGMGYTSVMYDGSALSFEANVRNTTRVVESAHRVDAWVEAELAGIAGNEDESRDGPQADAFTDPEQAAKFVAETGVDALAVAVGNVHGIPDRPVRLNLELLDRIGRAVDVPLVLHGASGLPTPELRTAIGLGVAKLNVNTELRRAVTTALVNTAAHPPDGDAISSWMNPVIDAVEAAAREKILEFTVSRMGVLAND